MKSENVPLSMHRRSGTYVSDSASQLLGELRLAGLAASDVVQRLHNINFMGVLCRDMSSVRYSRAEHSVGTAVLTYRMLRELPSLPLRHAVAAALLHDAPQWAFSHTCEGVFQRISAVNSKRILHAMLFADPLLDRKYHLGSILSDADLDAGMIWELLRDKKTVVDRFANSEWAPVAEAFACAMNPDTLDGITRAAEVFGVVSPDPMRIANVFFIGAGRLRCRTEAMSLLDRFWRAKAAVYEDHIHAPASLATEVSVSRIVLDIYHAAPFHELFDLSDDELAGVLDRRFSATADNDASLEIDLLFRYPNRYLVRKSCLFAGRAVEAGRLAERFVVQKPRTREAALRRRASRPAAVGYHYSDGNWQRPNSASTVRIARSARLRPAR